MRTLFTRQELEKQLVVWKEALMMCATGKKYEIDGRSLTRQDLPEIRGHLAWLSEQLAAIEGRGTTLFVKPRIIR